MADVSGSGDGGQSIGRESGERAGLGLLSRFLGAVFLVMLGGLLLLDRALLRANRNLGIHPGGIGTDHARRDHTYPSSKHHGNSRSANSEVSRMQANSAVLCVRVVGSRDGRCVAANGLSTTALSVLLHGLAHHPCRGFGQRPHTL